MKFKLDLNLDDEREARAFYKEYGGKYFPDVAKTLGLVGDGAAELAESLVRFASQRVTAFEYRRTGLIAHASLYEKECDKIYRNEIAPVCDCW